MAIQIKKSHQGRLHENLGVPEGRKIPLADLMKAKRSRSPEIRRQANFALNARKWKKK